MWACGYATWVWEWVRVYIVSHSSARARPRSVHSAPSSHVSCPSVRSPSFSLPHSVFCPSSEMWCDGMEWANGRRPFERRTPKCHLSISLPPPSPSSRSASALNSISTAGSRSPSIAIDRDASLSCVAESHLLPIGHPVEHAYLIIRLGDGTAERCFGILRTNVRTRALCVRVRYWFWLGRAFLLPVSFSPHYRSKLEYSVKESSDVKILIANFHQRLTSCPSLSLGLLSPSYRAVTKSSLCRKKCVRKVGTRAEWLYWTLEVIPLPCTVQHSTCYLNLLRQLSCHLTLALATYMGSK